MSKKSYKGFSVGETICFLYVPLLSCVEGTIKDIKENADIGTYFRVDWKGGGTSNVKYDHSFKSKELCLAYADSLKR